MRESSTVGGARGRIGEVPGWSAVLTELGLDAGDDAEVAALAAGLDADRLARLAEALWWSGRQREAMGLFEDVYGRYLAEDRPERAARTAVELALLWFTAAEVTIGEAWCARARRLLADLPDSEAHGYLLYLEVNMALSAQEEGPDMAACERVRELGRLHGAPELECLGLALRGLTLVQQGRCEEGFAALDEAMLPVVADRIPPLWAGDVYCLVIHVCYQLADLRRMRAWTDVMQRWCDRAGEQRHYRGVCEVHRLELQGMTQGRGEVEPRLLRVCAELTASSPWAAGEGYEHLGELRRRAGDLTGAQEALTRARSLGIDPQPAEARLLHDQGRSRQAAEALTASLAAASGRARPRLLSALVEITLEGGDLAQAREAAEELADLAGHYGTPGFHTWARQANGGVLLAGGEAAEAVAALDAAVRVSREAGDRFETARCYVLLARAHERLGHETTARVQRGIARDLLVELGAAAVARSIEPAPVPGGLSPREVEVLTLAARGESNRAIARALHISEKTAGRHLSNIYAKLDVGTRTAAAAWARDHGLLG